MKLDPDGFRPQHLEAKCEARVGGNRVTGIDLNVAEIPDQKSNRKVNALACAGEG